MPRIHPPLIALGAAVLQRRLSRGAAGPSTVRRAAASTLAAGSASLSVTAIRSFRRRETTIEPLHPDQTTSLVTDGVFTVTRNPMYVGLAGVLTAHAVWRGSWAALLPLAGFVAVIDRSQIAAEEAALRMKFGPEFEAYRASTPRWVDHRSFAS